MSDNFKPLDSYRFTMDAIDKLEQLADFKIWRASESDYHPSFYSFLDELDVRAEWWHPKHGDVVCDVGADYGSYTLPALAAGAYVLAWSPAFKTGKSFEADVLERSAKANSFERLTTYRTGLWSRKGWLKASDWSMLAEWSEDKPEGDIVFQVETLDAVHPHACDWLKIDAEGAELHILQGGEQTIRRSKPRILLEHHLHIDPDCRTRCTDFLDALDLGYKSQGYRPHGAIAHEFFTCE